MKKRAGFLKNMLTFIVLAFLIGGKLHAQQQMATGESVISPKFGIKGGVNLSNLYVDNVQDENMKVGLNLGVYAKLPLSKGFSIQPELIYSSKGAKLTYNNILLGKGEYRFNLNYVELPVVAVINVAKNININGGGYVAYLSSANVKDMDNNGNVSDIKNLNADNFNRFDYGVLGGVGVDVQNFTVGARYTYGLKEVGTNGSLSGKLTENSKNSVISLFIGFGF